MRRWRAYSKNLLWLLACLQSDEVREYSFTFATFEWCAGMCGIVGLIGSLDIEAGQQALLSMAHRGPDGDGDWISRTDGVWLGHRRLVIIDPEGGKQPFTNEDESLVVTFNGCIYNYLELREQLIAKGYQFRTRSDTEVIIHAYAEYGDDCVTYFNGMFAFALWDARRKRLFCARDRLGEKPFYYRYDGKTFLFASEIKGLLATGLVERAPKDDALRQYLTFQLVLDDQTLFAGIKKLMPGNTLVYESCSGQLHIKTYWNLHFAWNEARPEADSAEQLAALLQDAVRLRLRSDVPLGAQLSGGLDSSIIVSLASRLSPVGQQIKTFTGAFREGPQYDETAYARLLSESAGTEYHEIYITPADFMESIHKIMYHMDEPAAGPGVFPQMMVARAAAASQVKVVLGGQGGDEIFAGYARYLVCYLENVLKGAIQGNNNPEHYASVLASLAPNLAMLKQYEPMLRSFWSEGLFADQDRRYFQLMDRSASMRSIFMPDVFENPDKLNGFERFQTIFHGSSASTFLERMLYFDLKVHLPGLLHVEDRTSMAYGLESRVPMLDHRIVEFMATVPPVIKFKGGQPKYLLRQAIGSELPKPILDRKDKMGFPFPLSRWCKGPLKNYIREILLDDRAVSRGIFNRKALEATIEQEHEFGRAIWGALCTELWFKTFMDHQPSPLLQRPLVGVR
jgi:asparagine synthase (glutamine-hydrolysing)